MLALDPGRITSVSTLPTVRGVSAYSPVFALVGAITRNLVAAALLIIGVTAPAAQTFTVTTTADNVATPPAGSLRKAIADAVDGDSIEFQAGLAGAVTLAGTELLLDKSLTIAGPGATVLAISGNQQSRIFRIPPGKTVTISGLTVRDGKAADGADVDASAGGSGEGGLGQSGGAVFNEGTLTMAACRLTNNAAGAGGDRSGSGTDKAGDGGDGGAIFSSGTLTLTDCALAGNRAGAGGGKFNAAGVSGNGGSGGAIHVSAGQFELQRCTVDQNEGGAAGLGNSSSTTVRGGDGGGISIQDGTALLKVVRSCRTAQGQVTAPWVTEEEMEAAFRLGWPMSSWTPAPSPETLPGT